MFKRLNLLRIDDIFTCQCMSFYHKYVNNNVPLFCKSLFTCNATHHEYQTRHNMQLSIPYSHTSRARKSIRYHLPSLLKRMPQCVIEKIHTHSLNGFSLYLNPRNGHVRSIGRKFLCAKRPEPIRPVADVVLFTVLFIHK